MPHEKPIRPLRSDAARNHEAVLAAARRVYSRRGLAAGFDEIARAAGVGVGTVYRRFPDRDALLNALFDERLESVGMLAASCIYEPDPWRGFERFLLESVQMFGEDRGLWELTFADAQPHEGVIRGRERLAPLLDAITERARVAGSVRADFTSADLAQLVAMLSSVRPHPVDGQDDGTAWRRCAEFVLDGVRA